MLYRAIWSKVICVILTSGAEAFAKAVRDGASPPVTAEQGARTLAVLDAARKSAAEGRTIRL